MYQNMHHLSESIQWWLPSETSLCSPLTEDEKEDGIIIGSSSGEGRLKSPNISFISNGNTTDMKSMTLLHLSYEFSFYTSQQ